MAPFGGSFEEVARAAGVPHACCEFYRPYKRDRGGRGPTMKIHGLLSQSTSDTIRRLQPPRRRRNREQRGNAGSRERGGYLAIL